MHKQIIFKTTKTFRNKYVYDRHTNSIVRLSEEEFVELERVEKEELPFELSPVIRKYQESGLFAPNVVEKIENPASMIIEQYMNTRLKQLTLQVTQQCNLRCEYCTYSGIYGKHRTHSHRQMGLETAKKAINFFLQRCSSLSEITIGFYGGEPLLELDLIKTCVDYARNCVEGKKITFNMTTNGTLLTDETADYLADNDFSLSISLDGSKEEHDASRKFVNGTGSFDVIIENIKRINNRRPDFARKIQFMTTVNPYMDLGCTLEYFNTETVFSDKRIIFNSMNDVGLGKELDYDDKYFMVRNYEYIKLLLSLAGKIGAEHVSPLMSGSRGAMERRLRSIHRHTELNSTMHHGGPCLPGVQRLFVRTDGALFPCERVNEALDFFKIGTLEDGFFLDKMKAILNIGTVTEQECKECTYLRHCSICSGQIDFEDELTKECKLTGCARTEDNTLFELNELCVLSEFGYNSEMRVVI